MTLIFGLERYDEVMDAFWPAWSRPRPTATTCRRSRSVASFFVSRVDTEVDKRLEKIGTAEALALRGKAAIANARWPTSATSRCSASDRWKALEPTGAHPQRPLWASTGARTRTTDDTATSRSWSRRAR